MIKGLTEEPNASIFGEACRFEKLTRLVVFGLNKYTKLPYKFDVIRFESINNPKLRQHITDSGKTIFPFQGKVSSD